MVRPEAGAAGSACTVGPVWRATPIHAVTMSGTTAIQAARRVSPQQRRPVAEDPGIFGVNPMIDLALKPLERTGNRRARYQDRNYISIDTRRAKNDARKFW